MTKPSNAYGLLDQGRFARRKHCASAKRPRLSFKQKALVLQTLVRQVCYITMSHIVNISHESYTQVDPMSHILVTVCHTSMNLNWKCRTTSMMTINCRTSWIMILTFHRSMTTTPCCQMLNEHDVAIPELETPKTYPRGIRFSLEEIDIIKERAKAAGCSFNAMSVIRLLVTNTSRPCLRTSGKRC